MIYVTDRAEQTKIEGVVHTAPLGVLMYTTVYCLYMMRYRGLDSELTNLPEEYSCQLFLAPTEKELQTFLFGDEMGQIMRTLVFGPVEGTRLMSSNQSKPVCANTGLCNRCILPPSHPLLAQSKQ